MVEAKKKGEWDEMQKIWLYVDWKEKGKGSHSNNVDQSHLSEV